MGVLVSSRCGGGLKGGKVGFTSLNAWGHPWQKRIGGEGRSCSIECISGHFLELQWGLKDMEDWYCMFP